MQRASTHHVARRDNLPPCWRLFLVGMIFLVLTGCGTGPAPILNSQRSSIPLQGNWQFTVTPPPDNSFVGGLQGGFLLQDNGTVTGGIVYSISLPQPPPTPPVICSSGSASVTGTLAGQNVTLTARAGNVTYTLTGTLSADGLSLTGTYSASDGQGCGTAQDGLSFTAISLPPITGSFQGSFHSVTSVAHLNDRNFSVSGILTQGENIGASHATVTGTLNFPDYPCLGSASLNGTISGNAVILQIIGSDGLNAGEIGAPPGFRNPSPVVFGTVAEGVGPVLQGANGYGVNTKACEGGNTPGDIGNICLALGLFNNSCDQPIMLSPGSLTFPTQYLGSSPTAQTITLTNVDPSGTTVSDLSLSFNPQSGPPSPFGFSDFNGLPNFTEVDSCANPPGSTFSLAPGQSCSITVFFSPQQSCSWLPSTALGGISPSSCPAPLTARVTVQSSRSVDADKTFAANITGGGFSAIFPEIPELDFGAEIAGEMSAPQSLSLINLGQSPVQILSALDQPCGTFGRLVTLPRPLAPGIVSGFQVLTGTIFADGSTIDYFCDSDQTTGLPNFQISSDNCSGRVLNPLDTCDLQVTFVPQPSTPLLPALDYFLELDTLQCTDDVTTDCEIDSGRFPVELKANPPSPLRMTPAAGLNFGFQLLNLPSDPLHITLFNDPNDPNAGPVNFTGNLVTGSNFLVSDDCGSTLNPGESCTLTATYTPKKTALEQGTVSITYAVGQIQTVYLRGRGCTDLLLDCKFLPLGQQQK